MGSLFVFPLSHSYQSEVCARCNDITLYVKGACTGTFDPYAVWKTCPTDKYCSGCKNGECTGKHFVPITLCVRVLLLPPQLCSALAASARCSRINNPPPCMLVYISTPTLASMRTLKHTRLQGRRSWCVLTTRLGRTFLGTTCTPPTTVQHVPSATVSRPTRRRVPASPRSTTVRLITSTPQHLASRSHRTRRVRWFAGTI
jgi:hypothetical protein